MLLSVSTDKQHMIFLCPCEFRCIKRGRSSLRIKVKKVFFPPSASYHIADTYSRNMKLLAETSILSFVECDRLPPAPHT